MPDLKRSRTLIGIAVPTQAKTPELARSRTLMGIAAPNLSTAPEPRKAQAEDARPGSDEPPATQPSESPIAAAVQGFLEDKPVAPSKPPPTEAGPAAAEPQPATTPESRAKVITLAEPLSKRGRAQSRPPVSEVPETAETGAELTSTERRGSGSLWVVLLVAAGLAAVGFWLMSSAEKVPEPAVEQAKVEAPPLPPVEPAPTVQPPEPAPPPPAAAPTPSSEPVAPAGSAAATSALSAEPPPTGETRRGVLTSKPGDAKFYRKGKAVSGSPMTVDLAPGEKRAFEVGRPGYVTRKVVVDGTKPEILVGLRPESAADPTPAPAGS